MQDPIQERLLNKFKTIPKWVDDFPVDQSSDTSISRRDFIRYLSIVSFGFFTGTFSVWLSSLLRTKNSKLSERLKIVEKDILKVGESYIFRIPNHEESVILIRTESDHYVAFGQKCTHLQCPVIWKRDEKMLLCPCHKGAFNGETGEVLYGPPERPLPKLNLEVAEDGVYFRGMERGELG